MLVELADTFQTAWGQNLGSIDDWTGAGVKYLNNVAETLRMMSATYANLLCLVLKSETLFVSEKVSMFSYGSPGRACLVFLC